MKNKFFPYYETTKVSFFILLLIVCIGFFLRIQGILTGSFAFTYDVGRDLLAIADIVNGNKVSLIGATTGLPGLFYGPWWYYSLILPFFLSQGNPSGIILFIVLTGIVTIVGGYILGKKISDESLGLVFAALISFSPIMISITSQIWNPNLAPLFLILIFLNLYYLIFSSTGNKKFFFYILGLLLTLSIDMEVVYGITLFVATCMFVVLQHKKILKISSIVAFIAGVITILLPRILFDIRHDFIMTKSVFSFAKNPSLSGYSSTLFSRLQERITFFFSEWAFTLNNTYTLITAVLLFCSIVIACLYYKKADKKEKYFFFFSLFNIFTFYIVLSIFPQPLWSHYTVGVPIFFLLFLSISLYWTKKYLGNSFVGNIIIALSILFVLNPLHQIRSLKAPQWEGDASVYRNQVAVVDYIYKQADGKPFKYILYTPPVHDFTFKYLFSWYGKKQYGYTPTEKAELFFVILEPDEQYPFRLTDWLKIREKDGKIIKDIPIKGGIRVQTRK